MNVRFCRGLLHPLIAMMACVHLVGCKAKLHSFTVEEKIVAAAHKPGRLPPGALHCQVLFGGSIQANVRELRDDYTGVVHIRATDTPKPCDADFDFALVRVDPPVGHRSRGSKDLDLEYWDLAKLAPRTPSPQNE